MTRVLKEWRISFRIKAIGIIGTFRMWQSVAFTKSIFQEKINNLQNISIIYGHGSYRFFTTRKFFGFVYKIRDFKTKVQTKYVISDNLGFSNTFSDIYFHEIFIWSGNTNLLLPIYLFPTWFSSKLHQFGQFQKWILSLK